MMMVITPKAGDGFDLRVNHTSMQLILDGLRQLPGEQAKDLANTIRDALVRWPPALKTV